MMKQGGLFLVLISYGLVVHSNAQVPERITANGRLAVRVVDENGKRISARAWVEIMGQRLFKPANATATPYAKDLSFSFDGDFEIDVPAGRAGVHVEKGKEYLPVEIEVDVASGKIIQRTIALKRWIDLPAEGWFSADLHVHLGYDDPRVLKQLALADDVHLVPSFSYWLRGREEAWKANWPDSTYTQSLQIDENHIVTRNNIELERIAYQATPGGTIGATFAFNLRQPITAQRFGEHFPTDAMLCRLARNHSPDVVYDSDKPSWAETVIGAALGQLDTVQVCHNHYFRFSTLQGGYGMIPPLVAGESNEAIGDGLFHRTNSLYYRFLNCGFRLGVSGGSAVGVMAVPTGYSRVYAKVEGPLSADKMWDSIRAGKTFATSGPVLTMTADGEEIGATLRLSSSSKNIVMVQIRARSIEPLEAIQLVQNGCVVASRDLLQVPFETVIDENLEFEFTPVRSGWLCARALFHAPDGLLRQAHTSPIYFTVDQKPVAFSEDARYMRRWVEQLTAFTVASPDLFPDDAARESVLATYKEASDRYEQILKDAQENWQDE